MPPEGEYLLTNVGFSPDEKPCLTFQKAGTFFDLQPLGKNLTLQFDTTQRQCIGWRDISNGRRTTCPDSAELEGKYEQCQACQERTGFNPAFYHATTISTQQEARNQEPHILYLARFGKGVIKVGISYAKRERSRLLEQGARDAIILDTFPSAHIARQYEAKIAAMPNIVETLQLRKKLSLLEQAYSHDEGKNELETVKKNIEDSLRVSFSGSDTLSLDEVFFPNGTPNLANSFNASSQDILTGSANGSLGSLLFCYYNDTPVYLPTKKYVGYPVKLSYAISTLTLPARQTSLF